MSKLSVTQSANELRSLLHAQLARLPDTYLETVCRFLQEIEIQQALESLGAATEDVWSRGHLNGETITQAIREHRQRHPYR
jgi:hypothetical protein